MTDLLPAQADVAWYGMRAWIECGFKDTKRGGWNWHHTKMTDPRRAERHWLVMAVARLWVISVGGKVDASLPVSSFEALPPTHIARRFSKQHARKPCISCFARGILTICAALLSGEPLPMGRLIAFPWPTSPSPVSEQATELVGAEKTTPESPPEAGAAMFRIVQEALSNVWRHANARQVSIDPHHLPQLVQVRIRDDGQGFVPTGQTGMGVINMRERALLISAELTITSAPQRGCTVALSWPQLA